MTSTPALARAAALARRVLPWMTGAAVVVLRSGALELVPPPRCPGLLDLLAVGAITARPELSLGGLFGGFHIAAIVAGVAAFTALSMRATNHAAVAASAGLAVGLSPLFPHALSPPWEATAFGLSACGGLLLLRLREPRRSESYGLALSIAAAALAGVLIVPAWTLTAAIAGAIGVSLAWPRSTFRGRWSAGIACAAAIAAAGCVFLSRFPPDMLAGQHSWRALTSCVLPAAGAGVTTRAAVLPPLLGPLTLALALLGAFAAAGQRPASVAAISAIVLAFLLPAAASAQAPRVVLAPGLVGLWLLAAMGLKAVAASVKRGAASRVALALLLVLMPALQNSRRVNEERDDRLGPLGHERVTLQHMWAMLNAVPGGVAFVEEDAAVDVLLRSAAVSGRRQRKPFLVVPRGRDDVLVALRAGPAYAFPLGQRDLRDRGFALQPIEAWSRRRDGGITRYDGLAVLTGVRPCRRVEDGWVDISEMSKSGRLTLVAASESARGPVFLYLGGSTLVDPVPEGWSKRALRGFNRRVFDQRTERPLPRLLADASSLGLPGTHPVLLEPVVLAMTLHRVPNAPLALAVNLGASFPLGVAKRHPGATPGAVDVCDAPAAPVTGFGSR